MGRKRRNTYIFAPNRRTHHLRNFFLGVALVVFLAGLTVFIINLASNNQVEYLSQSITVETLPKDLESFSILHMSDLHGVDLGRDGSALRRVIRQRNVSCIVMTGDMVGKSGNVTPLLHILEMKPEDVPVYIVAGDSDPPALDASAHDSISPYANWLELAVSHGAIYLDEPMSLVRGKSTLWLVPEYLYSLDLNSMEAAYTAQKNTLDASILTPEEAAQLRVAEYQLNKIASIREKLALMTDADVQVAVTHIPLTDDYVATMTQWQGKEEIFSFRRVSLVIAGHYCGGQWRLPSGGALYVPSHGWLPPDEGIVGLTYLYGIPQYISPGLGASPYYVFQPGRLFNSPAITYLQLTSRMV